MPPVSTIHSAQSSRFVNCQGLTPIFQVTPDYLFAGKGNGSRKGGPTGKARRIFEEVSRLPRSQQQHILAVVETFVEKKSES